MITTPAKAENTQKTFGFSALNRLKTPQEFQFVRQRGRRFRSSHLVLNIAHNVLGTNRLGVSIPKRHIRSAVVRNSIRRLIREYFRLHQHELPGIDVSVALLTRITQTTSTVCTELQGELTNTWKKAAASLVK